MSILSRVGKKILIFNQNVLSLFPFSKHAHITGFCWLCSLQQYKEFIINTVFVEPNTSTMQGLSLKINSEALNVKRLDWV